MIFQRLISALHLFQFIGSGGKVSVHLIDKMDKLLDHDTKYRVLDACACCTKTSKSRDKQCKEYGKTIERYGISYPQIYAWVRRYEAGGPEGLVDRRGKRKTEAFMTEVEKLRAQLKIKDAENLRLQMENDLLKKL